MRRAKTQFVLLAVTLLFANAWCIAQCLVTPSQSHSPPCHRHASVKPCASSVMVEAANAVPQSPLADLAVRPSQLHPIAISRMVEVLAHPISPPPPLISSPIRA